MSRKACRQEGMRPPRYMDEGRQTVKEERRNEEEREEDRGKEVWRGGEIGGVRGKARRGG